jgi:hypothetical protein
VTAVKTPDPISGNTFAVYYYTENAVQKGGRSHGENHTGIFKARPDQRVKK